MISIQGINFPIQCSHIHNSQKKIVKRKQRGKSELGISDGPVKSSYVTFLCVLGFV